jgi:hypothetical protein
MSNTNQLPSISTSDLSTATGGVSNRWLNRHPYAGAAFLDHHPRRQAAFAANHPYMNARIHGIAGY